MTWYFLVPTNAPRACVSRKVYRYRFSNAWSDFTSPFLDEFYHLFLLQLANEFFIPFRPTFDCYPWPLRLVVIIGIEFAVLLDILRWSFIGSNAMMLKSSFSSPIPWIVSLFTCKDCLQKHAVVDSMCSHLLLWLPNLRRFICESLVDRITHCFFFPMSDWQKCDFLKHEESNLVVVIGIIESSFRQGKWRMIKT